MHDGIGLVLIKNTLNGFPVLNIDLLKMVSRVIRDFGQRFQVARVSERIQINDFMLGIIDSLINCRMTAEPIKPAPPVMMILIILAISGSKISHIRSR